MTRADWTRIVWGYFQNGGDTFMYQLARTLWEGQEAVLRGVYDTTVFDTIASRCLGGKPFDNLEKLRLLQYIKSYKRRRSINEPLERAVRRY